MEIEVLTVAVCVGGEALADRSYRSEHCPLCIVPRCKDARTGALLRPRPPQLLQDRQIARSVLPPPSESIGDGAAQGGAARTIGCGRKRGGGSGRNSGAAVTVTVKGTRTPAAWDSDGAFMKAQAESPVAAAERSVVSAVVVERRMQH